MSFARILAPLTGTVRDQPVLAAAFALAKRFHAHVDGLFVRPDPVEAMPFYGEGMSSTVVQEIMDASKKATAAATKDAQDALAAAAAQSGARMIATAQRSADATASFREVEGSFADQVSIAARLADVVLFGALKESDRPGLGEAFEATLIDVGRPVLLVSQPPKPDFTKRIALAWNGSTASAHAVTAALPLLKQAESVDVLTVRRGNAEPIATDDLRTYLDLHGIAIEVRNVEGSARAVADVLLDAATKCDAGMLVAGGYGHNRLRELFVTGTTRRVAAHAALPCFLVH